MKEKAQKDNSYRRTKQLSIDLSKCCLILLRRRWHRSSSMIGDIKLLFYDLRIDMEEWQDNRGMYGSYVFSFSVSPHPIYQKKPKKTRWFFFYSIKRIWPLPATFRAPFLAHDPFGCQLTYHSSLLTGPSAPTHTAARMVLSKWNQIISFTCSNTSLLRIKPKSFWNGLQGPRRSEHFPFPLQAQLLLPILP